MTSQAGSAVQSAVPDPEPAPGSQGVQARAREASVPAALPVLLPAGTPSPLVSPQARETLGRLLGAFAVPRGTNVLHASGLHATHQRHKKAAGEWNSPAAVALRWAWGWLHLLLIDAPSKLLGWVTEEPARFAAAAALYYICTHWL
jgi:hypothetical protein